MRPGPDVFCAFRSGQADDFANGTRLISNRIEPRTGAFKVANASRAVYGRGDLR